MKKVLFGTIVIVLLLPLFFFPAALLVVTLLLQRVSLKDSYDYEASVGRTKEYDRIRKKKYTVASFDGYELHAEYLPARRPSRKFVIFNHGYSYTRYFALKFLDIYRDMDFNAILYDDRGHGENKKSPCTFGLKEYRDLEAIVADTRERFGSDIVIGLHGESMGSGLQTRYLGTHPDVAFVVNDCGFAVLSDVLVHKLAQMYRLPAWSLRLISGWCRLLFGYSLYKVRPIDVLKDNRVPICFIHGDADDFVGCSHSVRMHEATAGYSELHLVPGAVHAKAVVKDPEGYRKIVTEFVRKVLPE